MRKIDVKYIVCMICLVIIMSIFLLREKINIKYKEMKIDLVSTITINNQEKLIVVANRSAIIEKREFAKKLIEKYIDNSFDSMRISNDLRRDIEYVFVDVYLSDKKIEQCDPEMEIKYRFIKDEKEIEITIDGITYILEERN